MFESHESSPKSVAKATETQINETILQIEELEPLVAPSAVWGS
jgi:hypothetical protein